MTKVLKKKGMRETTFDSKKMSAYVLTFMALMTFTLPMMVFCAGEGSWDIAGAVVKVCQDIGALMTAILNPVCSVLLGFSLFSLVFGTNSKSADNAITRIKRIVICFVIFNCLGLILTYGTTLMQSIGGQSTWS